MAATDGQIVVAAARWSEEGSYLREFVAKQRLPAVVKIIKGQYSGLGVPTLPSPGLQSTALLVSAGRRHKIVAQAVKIKEGRRIAGVGPRLAIPDNYAGYFELLSEDGRAIRCMESVSELARRRPEEGCLVREPVRGVAARVDADGGLSAEGGRTVAAGEVLHPLGEMSVPGSKGRFLRCTDSAGATVLLGLEQRGKFSSLARDDNISGVHTAKNLLSKRMPLTVRLVHGTAPKGLKSHFVPELRLLSAVEEEHVFALPLQKEAHAVTPLPLAAPLKVLKTRNDDQLRNMMEFSRLVEKAARLVGDVADRLQVLDGKLVEPKRSSSSNQLLLQTKTGYALRRSASTESPKHHHHHHVHKARDENREPKDYYDEIDQIYDYVRGFAPLPKSVRAPAEPPEPPPIETIPTKKLQAEKRNRKSANSTIREAPVDQSEKCPAGLPKLYIKNGQSQRASRLLIRQKSASPLKEAPPPASPASKNGSPIFNIRYKSLNNLQQAMELDGTLDSSHSGGRTSGDSGGGGAKQPEKRSRKISRPRSLTNLVWELKQQHQQHQQHQQQHPQQHHPEVAEKPPKYKEPVVSYKKTSGKYSVSGHKRPGTLYL